jgi:hypothetical protein
MEDAAELHHSDSDEVVLFDDETTGGLGSKESAAMLKKRRNSLPVLKQTDKNSKTSYPFLENPDNRDVTLFMILRLQNCSLQQKERVLLKLGRSLLTK